MNQQPKFPQAETLDRLLRAAGVRIGTEPQPHRRRRTASLRKLLHHHRDEILQTAARHGASNVRVFGSVARGEERRGSDMDLLVDMEDGRSLLDQVRLRRALAGLLGVEVDVVTSGGLLKSDAAILEEAISICDSRQEAPADQLDHRRHRLRREAAEELIARENSMG